jgi:serine/threonine protein kinase HipA of HipAB toxin-antitoxin module
MTANRSETLRVYQRRAFDLVDRANAILDEGKEAALIALPSLRGEIVEVLQAYQVFKHERIFDPAVLAGGDERTRLGRAMKIECIAAGETFRRHMTQWKDDDIARDWDNYRAAARLTLNALRRHLENERDGIETLLALLDAEVARAEPRAG